MKVFPRFSPRLLLALTLILSASSGQAASPLIRLRGHVPRAAVAQARLLGRVSAQETVSLALTLPVRDPAGLDDLLRRLYTPGDPEQGRFLTPDEFTRRFGPTADDYAAVAAFARHRGLRVTGTHPNRLVLDVAGPANVVESALGVRLQRYQNRQGRVFRAPSADPVLPAALAGKLAGIVGLDTAAVRRPHLRPALSPADGTGPSGGLAPADIRTAYSLTGLEAQAGAGQAIALFELDGYTAADIRFYEAQYGLPSVPLQNILVDGFPGGAGKNADEVTLDIELAQALVPGLSKILVYETPNDTDADILDGYSRIATDDLAQQVSTSWGAPELQETQTLLNGENNLFKQMAMQGQSVVSVTGDNGAYDDGSTLSVDDPGSQPYVTGVGGTTLTTNGPGGAYESETAWGDPTDTTFSAHGSGGGGGFSAFWPVPGYQAGLQTHPTGRSVPDVSLDSDPNTGYSVYFSGSWRVYGGTSTAAPLWAGLTAIANSRRASAGLGPVGFLNPLIYQIGAGLDYANDFHDITAGTNLFYPALAGYDNATGWGTPIGSGLLHTLVSGLTPTTPGTITGMVTAADTGAPLPNAVVSAVATVGGATEGTATTGVDGSYTLSVASGLGLTVTVSAYTATGGGYGGAKGTATVGAGQTVTLSFALRPVHTFPAGLQMLSAPYAYTSGDDLAALFGASAPLPAAGPSFARWNPATFSYILYPAAPVNTLSPGLGYWARLPSANYLRYDGPLVPATTPFGVALSPGWNQIGDPFPAAVPLTALTAGGAALTSGTVVSPTLYRYDTGTGAYAALNPATDALQPYAGYWLYATQTTTLSIPAP